MCECPIQYAYVFLFSLCYSRDIYLRDIWCDDMKPIGTYEIENGSKVLYVEKPDRLRSRVCLQVIIHSTAQTLNDDTASFKFGGHMTFIKHSLVRHVLDQIQSEYNIGRREHFGLYISKDEKWMEDDVTLGTYNLPSKTKVVYKIKPTAPLHLAMECCDREGILPYMESHTTFDAVDDKGRTLLHVAMEMESGAVIIRYLLKKNVDPNVKDLAGNSALLLAAKKGYIKAIKLLLQSNKTDLSARNLEGMNVLHLLSYVRQDDGEGKGNYRSYLDPPKDAAGAGNNISTRGPGRSMRTGGEGQAASGTYRTLALAPVADIPRHTRSHRFRLCHQKQVIPCSHCGKVIVSQCQKCSMCKVLVHERCVASYYADCAPEKNQLTSLLNDLISMGASPLMKDKFGYLPLHYACLTCNIAVVKFYVKKYGLFPDVRSTIGESCLHLSVIANDPVLLKFLLLRSNNKLVLNAFGQLPFDLTSADTRLQLKDYGTKAAGDVWFAIEQENMEHLQELLTEEQRERHMKRGRDIVNESLVWACARKNWPIVEYLLSFPSVDPNFISPGGMSALHVLSSHTSASVITPNDAPLRQRDRRYACGDETDIARALELQDLDCKGLQGEVQVQEDQEDEEIVKYIAKLIEMGGKADLRLPSGDTLTHCAAMSQNNFVLQKVIALGAPVEILNLQRETPLLYAVVGGKMSIIKTLLNAGAKNVDVRPSYCAYSPLLYARLSPNLEISEVLTPFHNDKLEKEYKEKEKEREREKERELQKQANKLNNYIAARAAEQEKEAKMEKRRAKKYMKPTHSNRLAEISGPTDFVHRMHVDLDFRWSGDNPAEEFEFIDRLGAGAWGTVYKAIHKKSGYIMAIKSMPFDVNSEAATNLRKEINVFKHCDHPNVVRYFGCYDYGEDSIWLIMEYCSGGSIYDRLRGINCEKTVFDELMIATVIRSVLEGLDHMHERGFIHRDIKGGNILLDAFSNPKVVDFGLAAHIGGGDSADQMVGTPLFMAPEVVSGEEHDYTADVWSLGVTCLEMADGKPPWINDHLMRVMYKIVHEDPPGLRDPSKWSENFVNFIKACLVKDPKKRPTCKDLLQHPFILQVPQDTSYAALAKKRQLERIEEGCSEGYGQFIPHNLTTPASRNRGIERSPILENAIPIRADEGPSGEANRSAEGEGDGDTKKEEALMETLTKLENVANALILDSNTSKSEVSADAVVEGEKDVQENDSREVARVNTEAEIESRINLEKDVKSSSSPSSSSIASSKWSEAGEPGSLNSNGKSYPHLGEMKTVDGLSESKKLVIQLENALVRKREENRQVEYRVEDLQAQAEKYRRGKGTIEKEMAELCECVREKKRGLQEERFFEKRSIIAARCSEERLVRIVDRGVGCLRIPFLANMGEKELQSTKDSLKTVFADCKTTLANLTSSLSSAFHQNNFLDARQLEKYLDDSSFRETFEVDYDTFSNLPSWMQARKKQHVGLLPKQYEHMLCMRTVDLPSYLFVGGHYWDR